MRQEVEFVEDCPAVKIPEGEEVSVEAGTRGFLVQVQGGSATIRLPDRLWQVQVGPSGAEALRTADGEPVELNGRESEPDFDGIPDDLERAVDDQLRECYDPEIPVNIVELGLIYGVDVESLDEDEHRVDVKMTLTAQGCGMGDHLAAEAERKILAIPGVTEASVEVVWDPPWTPEMMSDEARQKLGFG